MRNYYVAGEWNTVCMRCGFKHKASELRLEWTGLRVCDDCYEPRHPQTLLKVPEERGGIPWSAPEPTDTFVSVMEALSTESLIPLLLDQNPDFQLLTEG